MLNLVRGGLKDRKTRFEKSILGPTKAQLGSDRFFWGFGVNSTRSGEFWPISNLVCR